MADDVNVKFDADFEKAQQALDKLEEAANKLPGKFNFAEWGLDKFSDVLDLIPEGLNALFEGVAKVHEAMVEWVQIAAEAEMTEIRLDVAVRNAGEGFGFTTEQLDKSAKALQSHSIFGVEAIKSAQQILVNLRLTGNVFKETQQAAADMASALGKDLPSAAQILGRAMTNPEESFRTLRTAGIALTESQQDLIKTYVEQGKTVLAQRVILDAVKDAYRGVGQAMADTAGGGAMQLENLWEETKKSLGDILLPLLKEIVPVLREMAGVLLEWAEALKEHLVGDSKEVGAEFREMLIQWASWVAAFVGDSIASFDLWIAKLRYAAAYAVQAKDVLLKTTNQENIVEFLKANEQLKKAQAESDKGLSFEDRRTEAEEKIRAGLASGSKRGEELPDIPESGTAFTGGGLPAVLKGVADAIDTGITRVIEHNPARTAIDTGLRTGVDAASRALREGVAQAEINEMAAGIREKEKNLRPAETVKGFKSGFEDVSESFKRIQTAAASTDDIKIPKEQLTALEKQILQHETAQKTRLQTKKSLDELVKEFRAGLAAVAG